MFWGGVGLDLGRRQMIKAKVEVEMNAGVRGEVAEDSCRWYF